MDNGQPVQSTNSGFFTSGAGTNDVEVNNFESYNNLDLTNQEWGQAIPGHNPGEIGNKAVSSIANQLPSSEFSQPYNHPAEVSGSPNATSFSPDMPPTDEVTPTASAGSLLSPPPTFTSPTVTMGSPSPIDKKTIKTSKHLSREGIDAVEAARRKFYQDGDAASFYDVAREMMEAHLDNSYGRKVGKND